MYVCNYKIDKSHMLVSQLISSIRTYAAMPPSVAHKLLLLCTDYVIFIVIWYGYNIWYNEIIRRV